MVSKDRTNGQVLFDWLVRVTGMSLIGGRQEVTALDGAITQTGGSHLYRVEEAIGKGGQAAVATITPIPHGDLDREFVVRVELSPRDGRESRRREVLLFLAHLSRTHPDRYPALIHTHESFVYYATPAELRGPTHHDPHLGKEPLWIDVQERCITLKAHMMATRPNGYRLTEGIDLVVPFLRTVGQLHADHKLIHRDIDEGNILVAPDGTLRLADWGVVVPMSGCRLP